VAREAEEYGGIKWGAAFFGWLSAMGMAVILTAIASAAGAAVGLGTTETVDTATTEEMQTIGIVGAIVLLVILFVAYFSGGYVAGRMARFDGGKQGLAVWLWAIIIAVVVAVLGLIAGEEFNVFAELNAFPRIPVNEGDLTTWGIIAAVAVALVSLLAAMLGGKAGMRYHRRVDTVDLP
jgi:amino acid transporter